MSSAGRRFGSRPVVGVWLGRFAAEGALDAALRSICRLRRLRHRRDHSCDRRRRWDLDIQRCHPLGNQLRGHHRLGIGSGCALLLQFLGRFLARTFHPPVGKAVERRVGEREARLRPDLDGSEGKRRRKIQRDRDHRQADQIGADQVEVVNERVGYDPAQQVLRTE